MFPIRDHNPSGRRPLVTWGLIALNLIVFVSYWTTLPGEQALMEFFWTWGLVPAAVTSGQGWETIVTSMFLHGGWMHVLGNMWFLWIFGDNLEEDMGHTGFLVFYLLSGLAAALAQILADPASTVPMVGASGAVAGVMGGYLLLHPKARVDVLFIFFFFFRIIAIPAWIVLAVWLGLQVFSGAATPTGDAGVAYWAHVGGFLAGLVLALPSLLRRGGRGYWQQTGGLPPHPEATYTLRPTLVPRVPRR